MWLKKAYTENNLKNKKLPCKAMIESTKFKFYLAYHRLNSEMGRLLPERRTYIVLILTSEGILVSVSFHS